MGLEVLFPLLGRCTAPVKPVTTDDWYDIRERHRERQRERERERNRETETELKRKN